MAMRRLDMQGWLAEVLSEAQDSLGAYELALGGAVLLGYAILWWLRAHAGWGLAMVWLLCLAAVWLGARLEHTQTYALGKRRFRGTLYRRLTWLVALGAFVLAWWPVALAHARGWHQIPGWHDGPLVMMLTLGLYHLAMGLKTRNLRWTCVGGALCLLTVLIPAVPGLRERLYLSTALLAGASLLAGGLVGRLQFEREARLPNAQQ